MKLTFHQNHDHVYPRETDREECQVPGCEATMYWRLHRALSQGRRR